MKIIVYGTPAPQGSKAFMGVTKTGRGILKEASNKVTPWRADVITACRQLERPGMFGDTLIDPFIGPLACRMVFSFWRPKSVKRGQRPYPSVTPDLSKLCRATEDALQAAGVIRDDCLIVEYTRLAKVYCNEDEEALDRPGCVIILGLLIDSLAVRGSPPRGRIDHAA